MAVTGDWYPDTIPEEREMYGAIAANIDDVDKTLQMEAATKARLKGIAALFIEYYDNMMLDRDAMEAINSGFIILRKGKRGIDPMPVIPAFHEITLSAGDFVGMEAEVRDIRRYMVGLLTWSKNMGDVLKMNGKSKPQPDITQPEIKFSAVQGNHLTARANKMGNDGIEYQYREAGTETWLSLITSGEPETVLEIPPAPGGAARKIEIQAVYIKKFKQVGNWSPIYTFAVG